jgi:hypothetical protein
MCKKRTETFIKLSSKYKVEKVEDVKELFIEGLKAVSEDSSESHCELSSEINALKKQFENQSKRLDERLNSIDGSMQQLMEYIIKPKSRLITFLGSKKFLVCVIIGLLITMFSGIGLFATLDKSANISEIIHSTKGGN